MKKQMLGTVFLVSAVGFANATYGGESLVNWESPHVHPLDITPDGLTLLAVNTADNRLEVFDLTGDAPVSVASIPVGLDPVAVRARSTTEAWVVNHISDSVSIVDLTTLHVVATLSTDDEPCDVVFAGAPQKSFVTCSQVNTVMVFDPDDLGAAPIRIAIDGEDPRALAVSPDGTKVYAAVFESGNNTTNLPAHGGGHVVLGLPDGPYGGQNPPPNNGDEFLPPINPDLPTPPAFGLIVGKNTEGQWVDDNGGDWTEWISGPSAAMSNRIPGWDMVDHDVAVIDTATMSVSVYLRRMMNLCMALAVNPVTQRVTVVGTEATNVVRFMPNLKGRFTRVLIAKGFDAAPDSPTISDLNPHLDYTDEQIAQQSNPDTASQELRDLSIGDPRAIIWDASGDLGYIAGMGSNNVVVVDGTGHRVVPDPIRVGEGPTGLALGLGGEKLYVLDKFEGAISVVNTVTLVEEVRIPFYDPTPPAIKLGRPIQYNTQLTSGLGQIACASCHVDTRIDRLAWDLGNPAGEMTPFPGNCGYNVQEVCEDFHPMKTAMLTQTLQDIIGHEPFHWRGDKFGLEDFQGAFADLQGDDQAPTDEEMQAYEDFLATIYFPPNPNRNFDNSLPTDLPLPDHKAIGRFEREGGLPSGATLPNGNAQYALELYRTRIFHNAGPGEDTATCVLCHSLPTGLGAEVNYTGDPACYPDPGCGEMELIPVGPDGEHHMMITGLQFSGSEPNTMKVAQLRNLYDRVGFEETDLTSRAGFGIFHDGSNALARFFNGFPGMTSDQDVADMIAFMMSFTGSELPRGSMDNPVEPPGPLSQDAHAAVGKQVTITETNKNDPAVIALLDAMMAEADDQDYVSLVVKGIRGGVPRGYSYVPAGALQSDITGEDTTLEALRTSTIAGEEITVTVVPLGTETRIGIDRDEDGCLDGDERLGGSDPADPESVAPGCACEGDANGDGTVDPLDAGFVLSRFGCAVGSGDPLCDTADQNGDNVVDPLDSGFVLSRFGACR